MRTDYEHPNQGTYEAGLLDRPAKATEETKNLAAATICRANVSNEIAKLVQVLFFSTASGSESKSVVFCGIDSGVGCSWVCAQAAETLANQTEGSVCLIDANLRSPSQHRRFRVQAEDGFAETMRQEAPLDNFVRPTEANRLWIMTSGSTGPQPNGALNPARLKSRFAELRNRFDFLLVDVPAITVFSDAVLLGRVCDGVVLVIESSATRREPARRAKQIFEDAGIPVLGAVLNKRRYAIPEAIYKRL